MQAGETGEQEGERERQEGDDRQTEGVKERQIKTDRQIQRETGGRRVQNTCYISSLVVSIIQKFHLSVMGKNYMFTAACTFSVPFPFPSHTTTKSIFFTRPFYVTDGL